MLIRTRRLLPLLILSTALSALALVALLAAPMAAAHADVGAREAKAVVIDTDAGLDDAVALAGLLQQPGLKIRAMLVVEGVVSGARGVDFAQRLLAFFNRAREIPLYRPASTARPAPPFRASVERNLAASLPSPLAGQRATPRPFSAAAFDGPGKVTVLALGPLTNLAAALKAAPSLKARIARVIFRGAPAAKDSWNVRFDPEAHRAVVAAGLPLVYVRSSKATVKSSPWLDGVLRRPDSPGARLLARLTRRPAERKHYLDQLASYTDELAALFLVRPNLFALRRVPRRAADVTAHGRSRKRLLDGLARLLAEGRQHAHPVVLSSAPLPARALRPDVRARRAAIIAAHGRTEWRAQLVMNELHQHLGAYSVIGVKMGLRGAELLNAPLHAMQVISHAAPSPPVSCLNDGVIVATGATPGRGLFHRRAGAKGSTRVRFVYNGRSLVLRLKARYQREVAATIAKLKRAHGLADPRYWAGVREKALAIWQAWHRRDLFEEVR